MNPTSDQTYGVVERIIYGVAMFVLMKAVTKGWITGQDAPYIAGGIVTLVGGAWAWWINRPKAIVQSAAALPQTVVVTTPALAASTPEKNIVSADSNKVVAQ